MADSKCHSIIEKCTRWEPDERFQSIEELEIFLTDFPHSKSRINKPIISFSSYKLPRFRTRKLWKMALALLGYLFCFYLCITVTFTETKNIFLSLVPAYGMSVCFMLLVLLSLIFYNFDYGNIRTMSFRGHSFPLRLRILLQFGVSFLIVILLMAIMLFFEGIIW